MKIKSFILTFLAVLAFTACNNEVINTSYENEEEEVKEKGYLVLNLTNPPTTRTSGSATDNGTLKESVIKNVTIIFTEPSGTKVISVFTPIIDGRVTEKIQIGLGKHDVYALVNCPITVEEGEDIERVIKVATVKSATSGFSDGSFFMVNQRNSSTENAGIETEIKAENSINNPAIVTIDVDRVACKILDNTKTIGDVSGLTTASGNIITDVEMVGFAILNVNKEFNLIQTWNSNNSNGITLNANVLSTPLYTGGSDDIVADQYFYNIGEFTTIEKDEDDNITGIVDKTIDEDEDVFGIFNKDTVYTTENRPTIISYGEDELSAGRGETTGVIYKVQAKKGENDMGTFYKYKNVFYDKITDIAELSEFAGQTLPLKIPELRALGIKVYENGVMYYTYFIRDPNVRHQYNGKNYYGVFRNSTYKLAINSISSIGDDVPGGAIVDPEISGEPGNPPIESDEAYIQVSVVVNKWVLNEIGIDF